jgi:hypothetical protein
MTPPSAFAKMRANRARPMTPEARVRALQAKLDEAEQQQWAEQRQRAELTDFEDLRRQVLNRDHDHDDEEAAQARAREAQQLLEQIPPRAPRRWWQPRKEA